MSFFRKKLFSAAIGDEILLAKNAKALLSQFNLPLEQKDILQITQVHGVDMATRCYYESLLQSEHGEFKKSIDSYAQKQRNNLLLDNTGASSRRNIKILVVPGMFYKEHPEVGADGRLVVSIAEQWGFNAEVLAIKSKGSVAENVRIIKHRIQHEQAPVIWLISISKGSGEVRSYLQSYEVPGSVKGWLNIAGLNRGSPHATRKIANNIRKFFYAVLCKLMSVDYQVLNELNPGHELWASKQWNKSINCIHIVPIPLRAHLQTMLRKRYEKLLQYGPNDGIVPVSDANELPGKIYPLWGVDHFMRTPQISELLHKLFAYIAQQASLSIKY